MSTKIAVISAALGGMCDVEFIKQDCLYDVDIFRFTDKNMPPRKTMSSRLQAKIPKMFGWLLQPDYDYYLWVDSYFNVEHKGAITYLMEMQSCDAYDISVFNHPHRKTVIDEQEFLNGEIKKENKYIVSRYADEWYNHRWFQKDLPLYACGLIFYRNSEIIQKMFSDWFNQVVLYNVNDQLSFPYVLNQYGIIPNVIEGNILHHPVFKYRSHKE